MDKSEINLRMRKAGIFAIRLVDRMLKQTFPRLNSFALVVLILLTGLSACYRSARGLDNFPAEGNPVQNDDEFLEMVQRKGFDFFWEAYNPETGLILDDGAHRVFRKAVIDGQMFKANGFRGGGSGQEDQNQSQKGSQDSFHS